MEVTVRPNLIRRALCVVGMSMVPATSLHSRALPEAHRAFIDGTGPGWRTLGETDFAGVNGNPDTWAWKNGLLLCSGRPIGVMRTRQKFTNLEMVVDWRMMRAAGNSGVFVWVPDEALERL